MLLALGLFLAFAFGACGDDRGTGAVQIQSTQGSEQSAANAMAVGGSGNDFIANRIRDRHRVVGEGRQPVTPVQAGTLQTSQTARLEIPVQGGHCYVAVAAGVPSVRFCAQVGGTTWAVEVRMYDGYGRYGLQIFGGEGAGASGAEDRYGGKSFAAGVSITGFSTGVSTISVIGVSTISVGVSCVSPRTATFRRTSVPECTCTRCVVPGSWPEGKRRS
jgi:hypothetical protein